MTGSVESLLYVSHRFGLFLVLSASCSAKQEGIDLANEALVRNN